MLVVGENSDKAIDCLVVVYPSFGGARFQRSRNQGNAELRIGRLLLQGVKNGKVTRDRLKMLRLERLNLKVLI